MNLRRAFERFATNELEVWIQATKTYRATGIKGSVQVYDRFISDRDFGQKKRIFLVPGEFNADGKLDFATLVLRVRGQNLHYLMESATPDIDGSGVYASSLVLREARDLVKIWRQGGKKKRASGTGYTDEAETLTAEVYADFSRYSQESSRDVQDVDYTIGTWYFPRATKVDLDSIIENPRGERFVVKEVTSFLNLLMVRVQERERVLNG